MNLTLGQVPKNGTQIHYKEVKGCVSMTKGHVVKKTRYKLLEFSSFICLEGIINQFISNYTDYLQKSCENYVHLSIRIKLISGKTYII